MRLLTECRVGPYYVEGLIGRGARGDVYRAHDTRRHRHVALKVLWACRPTATGFFGRFSSEARTVALLDHPRIASVYDVGLHDGMPFVVSELLQGHTLRVRLREGALPLLLAIRYGVQVADGLAAAHELGVTHRDLRPENVFETDSNHVKVLDFGLARCREEALELLQHGGPAAAASDSALSTIGYMSPEQVRGHAIDDRSDIFSLGVLLYEMISGTLPFRGESVVDTLNAILEDDPPPLRARDVELSATLERVIRRCLEKDRSARYPSARDVGFNLETSLQSTDSWLESRQAPQSTARKDQDAWITQPLWHV